MDINNNLQPHQVDLNKLNKAMQGKLHGCPLCRQSGTLSAMPTIMELRQFNDGNFIVGGTPIVPLVVLTCNNCGNTILINALSTGVLDPPADSSQQHGSEDVK